VRGARVLGRAQQSNTDQQVAPQPLVIKYKFANRLRQLVALPLALASARLLVLASGEAGPGALGIRPAKSTVDRQSLRVRSD